MRVACADPAWAIYVPVAVRAAAFAPPLVRRGDAVGVSVRGRGFTVSLDAVAEQDGGAGDSVRVRARGTGVKLIARVGADGALRVGG